MRTSPAARNAAAPNTERNRSAAPHWRAARSTLGIALADRKTAQECGTQGGCAQGAMRGERWQRSPLAACRTTIALPAFLQSRTEVFVERRNGPRPACIRATAGAAIFRTWRGRLRPILHALPQTFAQLLQPRQVGARGGGIGRAAAMPRASVGLLALRGRRPRIVARRHPGMERPLGHQGGAKTGQQGKQEQVLHGKWQAPMALAGPRAHEMRTQAAPPERLPWRIPHSR